MSPTQEWLQLLASWSRELLSATDRIHYLIGNRHQPTKGSYREMLLRRLLRRVLPGRYRVSTGFVYRGKDHPSRQIDILIWDGQEHSALLEEGELVILAEESVAAMVEVKTTLNRTSLRDALDLLHPDWLVYWRRTTESSSIGLRQQSPHVPVRAIFAYDIEPDQANDASRMVFEELAAYYRERFMADAQRALEDRHLRHGTWRNLIDVVCIARGPQIEQAHVVLRRADESVLTPPSFISCVSRLDGEYLSVGRFCMHLLWRLTEWHAGRTAQETVNNPGELACPGVCVLAGVTDEITGVRVSGAEVPTSSLYFPEPPLWTLVRD